MSISSFEGCQLASNMSQGYEKWGANASMASSGFPFQDETVAWWFHRPDIDECMAQGLSPRAIYFSPHISLSRPQLHVLRKWV